MRTLLAMTFLVGVMSYCRAAEAPSSSQEGPVWYWQAKDRSQRMKVYLLLDNKVVFTATFSIAHGVRSTIPRRAHSKMIRFSFRPERSIVWSGYQDENVASPAKRRIECDIWMAGADEHVLILGASFDRPGAILMNTLHLALPTSETRTEIADGLVVVTSPMAVPEFWR